MHLRALDPAGGRTAAVRVTDVVEPIEATRAALRGRGYRVHATLAGELGQILHLVCAQWDGAPPPARFRHSSGGAFVDMGVHEFDVVRWLTRQSVASVAAVQTPALDPRAARTPTTPRPYSASPAAPLQQCRSAGTIREGTSSRSRSSVRSDTNDRRCSIPIRATSPCWKRSHGKQTPSPSSSGAGPAAVRERRTPLRRCGLLPGHRRR